MTIHIGDPDSQSFYEVEVDNYLPEGATLPTLPDLTDDGWRDEADDMATDEMDSLYVYHLPGDVQLSIHCTQGEPDQAELTRRMTISEIIQEWDTPDDGDMALLLAAWGQDGLEVLTEADKDYEGPCAIWSEPNYYGGTYGAPTPGYITYDDQVESWYDPDEEEEVAKAPWAWEDGDYRAVFDSWAEADKYVRSYYDAPSNYEGIPACNVMSHGQAGSDDLTIVRAE